MTFIMFLYDINHCSTFSAVISLFQFCERICHQWGLNRALSEGR